MSQTHRFRPDDLRHLATDLLSRAGLGRERASALARSLLWYDAVGAHEFGIVGLDGWLSRLDRGEFQANQEGRVGPEHASTALLEAEGGLPPLVLGRAAQIAGQKARDTGVGIVRVVGMSGWASPSAAIAADLAIGPYAGAVLGPGAAQSSAIPSADGVPVVFDAMLHAAGRPEPDREQVPGPIASVLDRLAPWALLAGGADVLVVAVAVAAFESLGSFHSRVSEAIRGREAPAGWIFPDAWHRQRAIVQQAGVPIPDAGASVLRGRASVAGVTFPEPVG